MKFPGFVLTTKGEALLAKVQAGDTLSFTMAATGAGRLPPDNAPFTATASDDTVAVARTENGAAGASDVDTGFTITTEVVGDSTTKVIYPYKGL